jgi:hypothetical protein
MEFLKFGGAIFGCAGSKEIATTCDSLGDSVVRIALLPIVAVYTLNLGFPLELSAQATAKTSVKTNGETAAQAGAGKAASPALGVIKDLPVRKVVLYKNGVGYFEHAGQVNGSQRVAVDFTSQQLNDVLQSLTALDQGGGHISGVNFNSTTPIEQQLKTLALGLKAFPPTIAVYQALRGRRVEVTGAGAPLTGRLVNIEFRKQTDKNGQTSEDHYFLIVASDAGALRMAELTDQVSVRMLDPALQKQFENYLEIVASDQDQQVRHLVLEDRGDGERQLRVSYISEVPVWKSTYRIVFPREANGKATMQGWAVVDNTVGADWDNVQLSLVAGAPQSFIQPLSQPLYARRVEIPIATNAETTPQTHEAAEANGPKQANANSLQSDRIDLQARLFKPAPVAASRPSAQLANGRANGFGVAGMEGLGGSAGGIIDSVHGAGTGGNVGGGVYSLHAGEASGVDRASDAFQEGDVSTNAFDDFFEYALAQPVTIHKNESAMVPILQQDLPAEHITLWSEREATPLRAVWLENKSTLTLDSGSFSIFEAGDFAGEGLLDPIHPGEKRLLSYAADQAVRIRRTSGVTKRKLHHLAISHGVIVETYLDVVLRGYSIVNSADVERTVLIETPRQNNGPGWVLGDDLKAAETTPTLYRFEVKVAPHSTAPLEVNQHGPLNTTITLNANQNQTTLLLELIKQAPNALDKLKPVIDAQNGIADLDHQIQESKKTEETASADEARDRDNLTALKGNDAAKRFVDELNRAEDLLQSTRKQTADLEQKKQAAIDKLDALISSLSFEWDVEGK